MKNKGISLIVLIITIVVIVILATTIIVNIAQTNIIGNANEAVVKQDFKAMQEELNLYIAEEFANTKGKLDITTIDANTQDEVKAILKSSSKSKYIEYVRIVDGKVVLTEDVDEQIKEWANEAINSIGNTSIIPSNPTTPNVPQVDTVSPTVPTEVQLVVNDTSINVVGSGSTDNIDTEITYEYSIDNENWQNSGEFSTLTANTDYIIYVRAIDKSGNISEVYQKSIKTKNYIITVGEEVTGNNATIYGNEFAYNNPVIPVGFKAVSTGASWADADNDGNPDGWNDGLVIQDRNSNEFVWVPCTLNGANSTITYTKNFEYQTNYGATSSNTTDDTTVLPMKNETEQVLETDQIQTYEGFYIGRYEAGIPTGSTSASNTTGIPVVKKDVVVWGNINYTNAYKNALSFYSTNYVKSGIVTGKQWDTLCAWINSEKDANGNIVHNIYDSSTWGNHKFSVSPANVTGYASKRTAGFSEYWKAKNIYDVAGNYQEWSAEIGTSSTQRVRRGGNYTDGSVSNASASSRWQYSMSSTTTAGVIGFRIVLYVL